MSVELNAATVDFLGDSFTFLDCPGSIEFQPTMPPLRSLRRRRGGVRARREEGAGAAADPEAARGSRHSAFPVRQQDRQGRSPARHRADAAAGEPGPLVLRQLPIWENDIVTGFIDLALERAYVYREHAPSEVIAIPATLAKFEAKRFSMLEKLADYDDELMEQLWRMCRRPATRCSTTWRNARRADLPGLLRLGRERPRHLPAAEGAPPRGAVRRGDGEALGLGSAKSSAYVLKTFHTAHGGKLSLARVLAGSSPTAPPSMAAPTRSASPASSPSWDRSRRSAARLRPATRWLSAGSTA